MVTLEPWDSHGDAKETGDAKGSDGKETAVKECSSADKRSDTSKGDNKGGEGGLGLHLLKTPAKRLIRLPTEALAVALAAEWEYQVRGGGGGGG